MTTASSRTVGIGLVAVGTIASPQLFSQPFGVGARAPRLGAVMAAKSDADVLPTDMPQAGRQNAKQTLTGLLLGSAGIVAARTATCRRVSMRPTSSAVTGRVKRSPPPEFDPSKQIGAVAPLGFFDPLDFSKVGDEDGFRNLRASEIKHGRVAMMASVGLLGQHFIKLPGFEKVPAGFKALTNGVGILGPVTNSMVGFLELVVISGFMELAWREDKQKEPGNYGNPLGIPMYNEDMRNKEINNGRFAMICVLGIFAAEVATGKDAIQQFGF